MRNQLLGISVFCAACLALGAQGQTAGSPGSTDTSGSSSGSSVGGSQSGPAASQSYDHFSPTGRMGQHEVRASKLMGADVKSSSGEELGTISDVILNPMSGRIDFAVISLSATASQGTSTTPGSTAASTTTAGKLAPVPWTLLRASGAPGATGAEQHTFVFSGDQSKLQAAPSFDQTSWPDISKPEWRQSIFSYYGIRPGAAIGGASAPGGANTGGSSSSDVIPTPPASDSSKSSDTSSTPPKP